MTSNHIDAPRPSLEPPAKGGDGPGRGPRAGRWRAAPLASLSGASIALALLASPARADVPPPPPACASAGAPCRHTTSGVMGTSIDGSCLEACDGAFYCQVGGSCYPARHKERPFDRWAPAVPCSSVEPPAPAPAASAPAPADAPSSLSTLAATLIAVGVAGLGAAGLGGLALARRRPPP